jgi:single-strand DNA-binding protein
MGDARVSLRNLDSGAYATGIHVAGRYSSVTQFSIATNDYRGGTEKSEYHPVVTWDRLAEICGQYLAKGSLVCIEGRLQTRQWEDDAKLRHWKTEIVASSVEMLSGKRKKDYAAESAADALEAQATAMGFVPQDGAAADDALGDDADALDDAEEDEEALVAA